jgi:hypothetical protein
VALFPSPEQAGVTGSFRVIARDAYNNTVPTYIGTVHFTTSDPAKGVRLPANYTFTSTDQGIHTFHATLFTAGTQSLTATDTATSSITGSQTGIVITPAAVTHFRVYGFANPTTAGVAHSFIVQAKDLYGNVVTGYTGTVSFSSSDSQATLPAPYTFTSGDAGIHTFSGTLVAVGTQTITATDTVSSSITGAQTGIAVNAAGFTVDNSASPNTLLAGDLELYVNDPNRYFTPAELTRIQDAITTWNSLLAPYHVQISEVGDPTLANLVIDMSSTSPAGTAAEGVLGCYDGATVAITLLQGWNWYDGSSPIRIGPNQY